MNYEDKDITLTVPDHWDDRSVIAFSAPKDPKTSMVPNIVMTREKPNAGETPEPETPGAKTPVVMDDKGGIVTVFSPARKGMYIPRAPRP
jgi:hypothetical protein